MKRTILFFMIISLIASCTSNEVKTDEAVNEQVGEIMEEPTGESENNNIKLGASSISLSVKDLKVSKAFYENLGFVIMGGGMEQNYLIMKNENSLIGLFQGMFEGNILTFNPGWDENGENIDQFDDVRKIQEHFKSEGIGLDLEADSITSGPASIMLTDPDGNLILIDQHR